MRGRPPLPISAPGWPLWLLRFEAATVYAASGMSKLLDPDWFSGTVTWQRVVLVRDRVDASVLPSWAVDVLTNRSFHTVAAKLIIATELFIAAGLWSRRTRYAAVWVAICFHVAIELSAEVQVFSFLAIAALVIWAVPSTRDRVLLLDPDSPAQRRFATVVGGLDWLARFRIEWEPSGGPRHRRRPRRACRRGAVGGAVRAQPATGDGMVRAARAAAAPRSPSRARPGARRERAARRSDWALTRAPRRAGGGESAGCRRDRLRCPRPAGALPPADRGQHRTIGRSGGAVVRAQPAP